jgi:hypothetical protein
MRLVPRSTTASAARTTLVRSFCLGLCAIGAVSLIGCGEGDPGSSGPVAVNPAEASRTGGGGKADGVGTLDLSALPDVRCDGQPGTDGTHGWNNWKSWAITALGSGNHRGIDLVAQASDGTQTLKGEIKYGLTDKSLEGEDVDLFSCQAGSWAYIGQTTTDGEGNFSYDLTGDSRLSIGLRDMFVSVRGDRSGARFVALVAFDGSQLAVSDVDGTLTSSENAYPESLVTGATVDPQPGAPDALTALNTTGGLSVVYLTARGRRFTQDTRDWLDQNGFPRGPLRLAPSVVTLPGSATVSYKTGQLTGLGMPIAVGIGNRASDIQAYTNASVAAEQIFIKLPEYQSELQSHLDAGEAVGFQNYSDEIDTFSAL